MQIDRIMIEWVFTIEMSADNLIKKLLRQKHEEFVKQLNLIDIIDLLIKKNWFDQKIQVHQIVEFERICWTISFIWFINQSCDHHVIKSREFEPLNFSIEIFYLDHEFRNLFIFIFFFIFVFSFYSKASIFFFNHNLLNLCTSIGFQNQHNCKKHANWMKKCNVKFVYLMKIMFRDNETQIEMHLTN